MTQKQFKNDLLRGLGRCIIAAKAQPEKCRSVVMWACSHEVAFDPQCEGTRAWFVYQLTCCYPDRAPFLNTAIASLEKTKSDGGWKMLYLSEILSYFAGDGVQLADQALWRKYEDLYTALKTRKRPPEGIFPERDAFAMLCEVLAESKTAMVRIAEDIGRLYLERPFYDGGDFDWLYASKAKRYLLALTKQAQKSENVAEFLRAGRAEEERWEALSREHRTHRSGIRLSVWLRNKADHATVLEHATAYLKETDPAMRAEALEAFCRCPYPQDPTPIILDAESDHEQLRTNAWRALENIRHPLVRGFAVENLEKDIDNALPVFIRNYREKDAAFLTNLVQSIPPDFESNTAWHGAYLDVLGMKDHGLKAPACLLEHVYENSYCSCCRENALTQMGRRGMLTNEMLEECLLDSNDDIRSYARRRLQRKNRKTAPRGSEA